MEEDISRVVSVVQEMQEEGPPSQEVSPVEPPSDELVVRLPVGLVDPIDGFVREAEVRELNGYDEEVVARCKTNGMALAAILERATVRVGQRHPSKQDLLDLTIGDRMELLLAIRRATWGDGWDVSVYCERCRERVVLTMSITHDIPRRELSDPMDYQFEMVLSNGAVAEMRWPSGRVHARTLSGELTTSAELSTAMIADSVQELGNIPVFDENAAKALSLKDRSTLVTKLVAELPGPVIDGIKKECPTCNEELEVSLDLGSMFLL